MSTWTDERIDLLTRLWAAGRSISEIAAEMGGGITRNAVIGKKQRLGLPDPASPKSSRPKNKTTAPIVKATPKPVAPPVVTISAAPEPEFGPEPEPTPPIAAPEPVAMPAPTPVTILELRDTMCRWPLGDPGSPDFRYCGSRATHRSYCEQHAQLAYPSSQERRHQAAPAHHPRITAAA